VLGNDEFALALVMTVGVVIALFALITAGVTGGSDDVSDVAGAVVDPA
jgi:DHA1 family bicyclomycin/chloramphenicol resistance-like MFS transporter